MAREHAIIFEHDLRIPTDAFTQEGFSDWMRSEEFPETGRIDFLAGDVEVEMSPEDLYTHGVVKTAVVLTLGDQIVSTELGDVFTDSTRVTSRFAQLSAEPDVVGVFRETLESGRVRLVPSLSREADRYLAIEGAPDLVVEVVSDSSEKKDTERLPPLYARAGIPEMWLADARGLEIRFTILTLVGNRDAGSYRAVPADADGWTASPRLGRSFRLIRRRLDPLPWRYVLEHKP
jgi:Uma2 family endonuclease